MCCCEELLTLDRRSCSGDPGVQPSIPGPWAAHVYGGGDCLTVTAAQSKMCGSLLQTALGYQVSSLPHSQMGDAAITAPTGDCGFGWGEHSATALTVFVCSGCTRYMMLCLYLRLFIREGVAARATQQWCYMVALV